MFYSVTLFYLVRFLTKGTTNTLMQTLRWHCTNCCCSSLNSCSIAIVKMCYQMNREYGKLSSKTTRLIIILYFGASIGRVCNICISTQYIPMTYRCSAPVHSPVKCIKLKMYSSKSYVSMHQSCTR